jgi:SulP family sulfate permease
MKILRKLFPFLAWAPELTGAVLQADLLAGVTVALVLVPQSMAYAQLAGLPPYYGLYAAFLPPMVASLFGSSRHLATGPVAVASLMTAAALEPLATAGSQEFIAYAILLALLVGVFQFLLGVLRLGLVVNFLSHPVVNGFTNAAALIIATSQLDKIFGVTVEKAPHHYQTVLRVLAAAVHWIHLPTLGMAVLAFGIIVGLRRLHPKLPAILVAVVVTTLLSAAFHFEREGVARIEEFAAPGLAEAVGEFNTAAAQLARLEAVRSEGSRAFDRVEGATASFCQRCHPSRAVEAFRTPTGGRGDGVPERTLALHHMAGLLDRHIAELRELVAERRQALTDCVFVRVETGDGPRYYPANAVPAGATTDGRRWRLKVGAKPLDVASLRLMGGGAVVGSIPHGLPSPRLPRLNAAVAVKLLPSAVIIAVLGFMEAISIAKAMAAKTRQRLDPNQELIGQGLANIVGCCFQGYAVSGSFSRSAVNLQAGGRTGLANVFSSLVVVVVLLFLSPTLYALPQAVLAVIIMLAVFGLLNVSGFVHAWRTDRFDGAVSVITLVATLLFAPHLEWGIFTGVTLSLGGYLFRSMRPRVMRLVPTSDGTVVDAARHRLGTCRYLAVVGFDGPLNFVSTSYLEDEILARVAEQPNLRHLLISGQGITEIDASGEETLRHLVDRLRWTGIEVSIAGFSEPVLEVLRRSRLLDRLGAENVYNSPISGIAAVYSAAHRGRVEEDCPFRGVVPKLVELSLHPDGSLRDVVRHRLPTCRYMTILRIDSPLSRGTIRYLEEWVEERIADAPELRAVILAMHPVTGMDTEAASRLAVIVHGLRERGLGVGLSGVGEEVRDVLERSGALEVIGRASLFATQAAAIAALWAASHRDVEEVGCPLSPLAPHLTELSLHPEGTLRDAHPYGLRLCKHVGVLRVDGPLPFADPAAMPHELERWAKRRPGVRHIVLVGTAVGRLEVRDAENLLRFVLGAREQGFRLALSSFADQALELLARTGAVDAIGIENFFAAETAALASLWDQAHAAGDEPSCPLEPLIPRLLEVSLHPDGSLRDAQRYGLARCRYVSVLRFDGPLDYSTIGYFQRSTLALLAAKPELRCVLFAAHTLERIDAAAAEELVAFLDRLRSRPVRVGLSGAKDEVLDLLLRAGIRNVIGDTCLFPTQARALEIILPETHRDSEEEHCPLAEVVAAPG